MMYAAHTSTSVRDRVLVSKEVTLRAIAVLRLELERGSDFDTRSARIAAALGYLERALPNRRPVEKFRRALDAADPATRWRRCSDCLATIQLAILNRAL